MFTNQGACLRTKPIKDGTQKIAFGDEGRGLDVLAEAVEENRRGLSVVS